MIEQRILNFFYENVKGKIPHKSYVIDFCIIEGRIYIVELNPFVSSQLCHIFIS